MKKRHLFAASFALACEPAGGKNDAPTSGSTTTGFSPSSSSTVGTSSGGDEGLGSSSSSSAASSSTGSGCLPEPTEQLRVELLVTPLPNGQIEATVEGVCDVRSRSNNRLALDCPDDVEVEFRQVEGEPMDFSVFPPVLDIR